MQYFQWKLYHMVNKFVPNLGILMKKTSQKYYRNIIDKRFYFCSLFVFPMKLTLGRAKCYLNCSLFTRCIKTSETAASAVST